MLNLIMKMKPAFPLHAFALLSSFQKGLAPAWGFRETLQGHHDSDHVEELPFSHSSAVTNLRGNHPASWSLDFPL